MLLLGKEFQSLKEQLFQANIKEKSLETKIAMPLLLLFLVMGLVIMVNFLNV